MSAIDFHTHAFPDEIAERAIAKLEAAASWKAVSHGKVDELLKSMDAADVDISVICSIATKPDQAKGILEWCKRIASDRIIPLPSVHPQDKQASKWLRRFAKEGFIGIKLHPMYQEFAADESRMDPVYATAAELGLLIVSHCGKDVAYPNDDDRASPQRFRNVIDRFGDLRLVCTHLGGWRDWAAVEQYLLGTSVLLETSFSIADLGAEKAADMIRRHGVDRVMMGSDWPWNSQAAEIANINSLPLSKQEKQKILWSNAGRLLTV